MITDFNAGSENLTSREKFSVLLNLSCSSIAGAIKVPHQYAKPFELSTVPVLKGLHPQCNRNRASRRQRMEGHHKAQDEGEDDQG